jgi:hypothetical protein
MAYAVDLLPLTANSAGVALIASSDRSQLPGAPVGCIRRMREGYRCPGVPGPVRSGPRDTGCPVPRPPPITDSVLCMYECINASTDTSLTTFSCAGIHARLLIRYAKRRRNPSLHPNTSTVYWELPDATPTQRRPNADLDSLTVPKTPNITQDAGIPTPDAPRAPPVREMQGYSHTLSLRMTADQYRRLRRYVATEEDRTGGRVTHQSVIEAAISEWLDKAGA